MYTLQVITPPTSEPVTVADMHAQLRLNDSSEDALIATYISAAREMFEKLTLRTVLPTTYRQHVPYFTSAVTLMMAPVIAVNVVNYWDINDTLQTATVRSDTISLPGTIWMDVYPVTSANRQPKAYVEYVAGWANLAAVPAQVRTGIMLLAAHYYEHRESSTTDILNDVPQGFTAICNQYKTGMVGSWGA